MSPFLKELVTLVPGLRKYDRLKEENIPVNKDTLVELLQEVVCTLQEHVNEEDIAEETREALLYQEVEDFMTELQCYEES